MSRWLKNVNQILQNLDHVTLNRDLEADDSSIENEDEDDQQRDMIVNSNKSMTASQTLPRSGQTSQLVEEILIRRGLLNRREEGTEAQEMEEDFDLKNEEKPNSKTSTATNTHTQSEDTQPSLDKFSPSLTTSTDALINSNVESETIIDGPNDTTGTNASHQLETDLTQIHLLERQVQEKAEETMGYIKEIKKLRRQLSKLNGHVEEMEREMNAQHMELERAAERIEKDRAQAKVEKERLIQEHNEVINAMNKEHKGALQALNTSHSKQISDLEESMRRAEETQAKEGGNLSMELSSSIHREQEALKKVVKLEDDKSILEIENSSLSVQIAALQSRIEVLMQSMENATKRERDIEDRFDTTLSLHARQMDQIRAREAELEKTICQLVTELARKQNAMSSQDRPFMESIDAPMESSHKWRDLQAEVESLKEQVTLEEQRSKSLLQEIQILSQERIQEASWNMERQKENDRLVAQHALTIANMDKKLREYEMKITTNTFLDNPPSIKSKDEEHVKQVSELTHELVRQQAHTGSLTAEIATLKSRLRDALDRAEKAESASKMPDLTMDVELGSNHVKQRRRHGTIKILKLKRSLPWVRRGFLINNTFSSVMESMDEVGLEAMAILRIHPVARIIFLLYLVILHVWVLVLFLFHAHHDPVGSDASHHGPHQLLRPG